MKQSHVKNKNKHEDDIVRGILEQIDTPEYDISGNVLKRLRAGPAVKKVKISRIKRISIVAVIAAVVILSGFTYGNQIIEQIKLLGGGRIESGKTSDGWDYISVTQYKSSPAEVKDGKVYFILDGSNTDITSCCTEVTYYKYEKIADNGYRHVIIVGGPPDNLGWSEFIWDENGNFVASTAQFHEDENGEQPEWLKIAEGKLKS